MKTILCLALSVFGVSVFAAPDYEPFSDATASGGTSYTPGSNLAGQSSASYAAYTNVPAWYLRTGPGNSGTQPTLVDAGLSYAGIPTSGGGAAAFGPNGNSALMNLSTNTTGITPTASRTVYYSYLLRLTDLTGLSAVGARITGVDQLQSENNQGIPSMGSVLMVRSDGGTGFNIGLDGGGKGGTHATIQWDAASHTVGETLLVIGSYDFGATTSTGFGEVWINPTLSDLASETAPAADLTSSGNNTSLARVASIILLQDTAGPSGQIDDLRIGTTWADVTVVPEPSSLALGAAGVATWMLLSRRFRRKD